MTRTTELHLPVLRDVGYLLDDGGSGWKKLRTAHVFDRLPVSVDTVEAASVAARRTNPDGLTDWIVLVAEGKPLVARPENWPGMTVADAVARMESGYETFHNAKPSSYLDGKQVKEDGRTDQERERLDLEAAVVLYDGKVYERLRVPPLAIQIDESGRVRFGTLDVIGGSAPSWMSFPLSRRAEALSMAEAVADGLVTAVPERDWRKQYPKGVVGGQFAVWTIEDEAAFAGLSPEWGGPGTTEESVTTFARDLVSMLTPNVGHFGDDVVLSFVFLRKAIERDDPQLRQKLEHMVDELAEAPIPIVLRPDVGIELRQASYCLGLRLRGYEPSSAPQIEDAGPRA